MQPVHLKGINYPNDRDFVLAKVMQDPLSIRYAPKFQNDKKVAKLAVQGNGLAIYFLSEKLQQNKKLQKIAEVSMPNEFNASHIGNRIFFSVEFLTQINFEKFSNKSALVDTSIKISSIFLRDSHVTLFSNKHLIPSSIQNSDFKNTIMAMLPTYGTHFFINEQQSEIRNHSIIGKGLQKENIAQAMITAYENRLSFKQGKTCIEGGNCFLFGDKAIVGELSLFLSMISLEEQGFFLTKPLEKLTPSSESIRIARNLDLLDKLNKFSHHEKRSEKMGKIGSFLFLHEDPVYSKEQLQKMESEGLDLYFRKLLAEPLSSKERAAFYAKGMEIEAKIKLTKAKIAKELELPLKNVIYIPQMKFHIDMEMFVTPHGELIIHDEQLAKKLLNKVITQNKNDSESQGILKQFKNNIVQNEKAAHEIQHRRFKILKRSEIPFRFMPLAFEIPSTTCLNFSNGIFLENKLFRHEIQQKFTFLTTGPSYKEEIMIYEKFVKLFNKNFPHYNFEGLEGMSKFISAYEGGIHCLTFEEKLLS